MDWTLAVGQSAPGLGLIIDIKTPVKEDPNKKLVLIACSGRLEGSHHFLICEWTIPSEDPGWVITSDFTLEKIFYKWLEM